MLGGCFSTSCVVFSMQFGKLPHTGSWAPCQMTLQSLHTTAVFVSQAMHITELLKLIMLRQVSSIGWSCRHVACRCRKTPVSPLFLILWDLRLSWRILDSWTSSCLLGFCSSLDFCSHFRWFSGVSKTIPKARMNCRMSLIHSESILSLIWFFV